MGDVEQKGRRKARTELQQYREQLRAQQLERRARLVELQEAKLEEAREQRMIARANARAALEAAAEQHDQGPYRMELHDPERSGMWSGLAVGLGVAAFVGVAGVVVYLLMRKSDGQVVGAVSHAQLADAAPAAAPMLTAGGGGGMKSWTLPSLNDKTRPAVRVAHAIDVPYDVVLRTIGPKGSWAAFGHDANELNTAASNVPTGDTIIIPAMQWQSVRLRPGQVLFAKGSQANVTVSVMMTELLEGLAATRKLT